MNNLLEALTEAHRGIDKAMEYVNGIDEPPTKEPDITEPGTIWTDGDVHNMVIYHATTFGHTSLWVCLETGATYQGLPHGKYVGTFDDFELKAGK